MIDLTAVEESLVSVSSAKRASDMKAYMKSGLDFIGVSGAVKDGGSSVRNVR